MKLLFYILSFIIVTSVSFAQSGFKVDEANTNRMPNASAILDAEATTKGVLIPQLTLTATNMAAPVTAPANSLLIFNTATAGSGATAVTPGFYYWDTLSDEWVRLLDPTNNVVPVDSAEWVDGSLVGLAAGNLYARKALARGDTVVINNSGSLGIGKEPNSLFVLDLKGDYIRLDGTSDADLFLNLTDSNAVSSPEVQFKIEGVTKSSIRSQHTTKNLVISESYHSGFTTVMVLDSGKVGVGTTSPQAKLDVNSNNTGAVAGIRVDARLNGTGPGLKILADTRSTLENVVEVDDNLGNSNFVIKSIGRVGIGSPNPYTKLQVSDSINGVFEGVTIDNRKVYGVGEGVNETSRLILSLTEPGAPDPTNRVMGYVESGTENENSSANGFLAFGTRTTTTASEKVRITSAGNVGIGTIAPSYKIHAFDTGNAQFGQWIQNTNATGNLASEILLVGQGSGKYGYLAYHNDGYSNALFPNLTPNTTLLYSTQDLVLNSGTTSHDIKFGNSVMGNESMVVKGNGRVGINVPAPATQLHVRGTSRFQGDGGVVLQTMTTDGLRGVDISNGSTYMDFRTPFNRWFINRNQPTQLELNQGGGFVGIGNPNGALPARLSVYGSTDNATSNAFLVGDSNTIANTLFVVRNDGNVGVGNGVPQARFHVTIDENGVFDSAVVVTDQSRVGVGTLTPTERLDVIGNIRASGNFISGATTLTVPDYVFETYFEGSSALNKAYQFKSLKEIEEFTKENKHLPGIPSAKEIKSKDQFNVTQSSLNNLEKIEELYLHLIEVNKEKDALKKEVEDLKIELKEIKDMLKNND